MLEKNIIIICLMNNCNFKMSMLFKETNQFGNKIYAYHCKRCNNIIKIIEV